MADIISGVITAVDELAHPDGAARVVRLRVDRRHCRNQARYAEHEPIWVRDVLLTTHPGADLAAVPAREAPLRGWVERRVECYVRGRDDAGRLLADVLSPDQLDRRRQSSAEWRVTG